MMKGARLTWDGVLVPWKLLWHRLILHLLTGYCPCAYFFHSIDQVQDFHRVMREHFRFRSSGGCRKMTKRFDHQYFQTARISIQEAQHLSQKCGRISIG
jgi:hypothetical protein